MRRIGIALLAVVLAVPVAWAAGALYFDLPASGPVRAGVAAAWAVGAAVAFAVIRPLRFALLCIALGFGVILAWWLTIPARQDREWRPEVAVLAHATVDGERVTIHNVRDLDYRTEEDFTPRYADRTYDLGHLRGLDIFQCYWGSEWMAHPILSFDFGPDGHVCFSIETRKEVGEGYSTLGGLYRHFELIYVVAEERDVVRVRTSLRQGEDVYLYRLVGPLEGVRELFLTYVRRLAELHARPEFYNALTANCTTSVRMQRAPAKRLPFDYRMILNGKADELLYERGLVDRTLPFEELKRRAYINPRAQAAGDAADFSARIRAPDDAAR